MTTTKPLTDEEIADLREDITVHNLGCDDDTALLLLARLDADASEISRLREENEALRNQLNTMERALLAALRRVPTGTF